MKKNKISIIFIPFLCLFANLALTSSHERVVNYAKPVEDTCRKITKVGYITESMNELGEKVRKYGNDSVYVFKDDSLSYVLYRNPSNPVKRVVYYPNGRIERMYYRLGHSTDSILNEEFYDDSLQSVHIQTFHKDTIIYSGDNPIIGSKLLKYFYQNGNMLSIKYFGRIDRYGTFERAIGVDNIYSEEGYLINSLERIFSSEHEPYIIIKEYYKNGKTKLEAKYLIKKYDLYSPILSEPRGIWKYYDENGELTRKEKHKSIEKYCDEKIPRLSHLEKFKDVYCAEVNEDNEQQAEQEDTKIFGIYLLDNQEIEIEVLYPKMVVTICIELEKGSAGKTVDLTIEAGGGRTYKGGKKQLTFKNLLVEEDNNAYLYNFSIDFDD